MSKKPPKWTSVYPQGTKAGDEEQKVFISLARSKWNWRSVAHIAAEGGLTKERTEQILNKYYKKGMVFQNPTNVDQWGYWERVPHMLKDDDRTIAQKDQDKRIDGAQDVTVTTPAPKKTCSCGPTGGCSNCPKPTTVKAVGNTGQTGNPVPIRKTIPVPTNAVPDVVYKCGVDLAARKTISAEEVKLARALEATGESMSEWVEMKKNEEGKWVKTGFVTNKPKPVNGMAYLQVTDWKPMGVTCDMLVKNLVFRGKFQEASPLNKGGRLYPCDCIHGELTEKKGPAHQRLM